HPPHHLSSLFPYTTLFRSRSFHVINFPAGKMRPVHFPIFALPVRCQDERALTCSSQYSYSAHLLKLLTADYADQGRICSKFSFKDRKSTRLNSSHLGISYA